MLDTGCWILDAGYWILDTGYWILDAGYSAGQIKNSIPYFVQYPGTSIQYLQVFASRVI
jgi:hypothetical protein